HLAPRHATTHRYDGCADNFCADMRTQPSGKQAITIIILKDIVGCYATSCEGTSHHLTPHCHICSRVASDNRFTSSAAGDMQPHNIFQWYSKEPIGIRRAEIIFDRERESLDIFESPHILWMHATLLKCPSVEWHPFIRPHYL